MHRILGVILGFFTLVSPLFANDLPFTDVKIGDPYYNSVKTLFDYGIVRDDGSHLFLPADPMNRDAFVGLSVSVSCHQCITPTVEDIIRYQTSPFVDLTKTNPYFYCIAYAADKGIVQGYILDQTGKAQCLDKTTFSSSPFCAQNQTSRIEAVGMLLRQAGLWNDTLNNTSYTKDLAISDVTPYWYGYAQKGIQVGILTLKGDKIFPDESISRGEYAIMAAKMLGYNQCKNTISDMSVASDIILKRADGTITQGSHIQANTNDVLIGITEVNSGSTADDRDWYKSWTLTHIISGKELTGSGDTFPLGSLDCGKWIATFFVYENGTNRLLSKSTITLIIDCANVTNTDGSLSVDLKANPLTTFIGNPVAFQATVERGNSNNDPSGLQYLWDFGDGSTSHATGSTYHAYTNEGYYTVTVTVQDPKTGETSQSSVVIGINANKDTDNDGVFDKDDLCPLVYGAQEKKGCPNITTNNYGDMITTILTGNTGDSIGDSDGDGIPDGSDFCPKVTGTKENHGCPIISLLSDIRRSACLQNAKSTTGLIIGHAICEQCPCVNSIEFLAPIRKCDVVFPAILSTPQDLIYSRGAFYQVQ